MLYRRHENYTDHVKLPKPYAPTFYFTDTKSNRKAMNRNWSNQKANPALKTKAGIRSKELHRYLKGLYMAPFLLQNDILRCLACASSAWVISLPAQMSRMISRRCNWAISKIKSPFLQLNLQQN